MVLFTVNARGTVKDLKREKLITTIVSLSLLLAKVLGKIINDESDETDKHSELIGPKYYNYSKVFWDTPELSEFKIIHNADGLNFNEGQLNSFERHPCRRICQSGQSMSCYYRLIVHNYQRLGAECQKCLNDPNACLAEHCVFGDGIPNGVMAVNRQTPGPAIEVCEGDFITIDVVNYLTEEFAMHWHGFRMSQTPEMDGASYITQYPIEAGEAYRYAFMADRGGTLLYHSHSGWQTALGLGGAFVVRQTKQANKQSHLYDYDLIEHTLFIQEAIYNYDYDRPRNILINGKGRNHGNTLPDNDLSHRYERLRISSGKRYRLRVISGGVFDCPIEFSIENHKMLMISADGNDIEPVYADKFFLLPGERFDFILDANQYSGNYWIRVRGYNECERENLYQGAVLHYRGSKKHQLPPRQLIESDPLSKEERGVKSAVHVNRPPILTSFANKEEDFHMKVTNIATLGLRSLTPLSWPPYTKFLTYYSSFGERRESNGELFSQLDDITFEWPRVSLLQAHQLYYEDSVYCNRSAFMAAGHNCRINNCVCTNVIRVPAYKPIELVIANYQKSTESLHTHGVIYRLVGQDVIGNVGDLRRIQDLDRSGRLQRLSDDYPAIEKDTIQVPGLGYIIVRFISDGPGFWLHSSQIDRHVQRGMAAILKVGETSQMKKLPPKLKC
ncbi:laccase-14 [Glossina fuscipes]|uniref:Laccase-14 n=1 Tax=Glossina fuscipes TaxID=7396 RepID=A0A9C5Z9V6_9MUSC|nr:laccase-14 [Glossina fuscipes]KAI9579969.1 hypothetical protein GQX74_000757 [Glossina fuscipes]